MDADACIAAAFTCVDTTNLCVFVTAQGGSFGAAGCCNKLDCGFRVGCLDYDDIESSNVCDAECMTDSFTLKW